MRTFLRIMGGIWAGIGVLNIMMSPGTDPTKPGMALEWVIIFNAVLFIGPGLLLAGIGTLIKQKTLEKQCPACAEMVKREATRCRYCNTELT